MNMEKFFSDVSTAINDLNENSREVESARKQLKKSLKNKVQLRKKLQSSTDHIKRSQEEITKASNMALSAIQTYKIICKSRAGPDSPFQQDQSILGEIFSIVVTAQSEQRKLTAAVMELQSATTISSPSPSPSTTSSDSEEDSD